MNNQEFFDKTVTHLRRQNVKSFAAGAATCLYRGENRTSCAIGCHIPDDKYHQSMENIGVRGMISKFPELDTIKDSVEVSLMVDMQQLHDSIEYETFDHPIFESKLVSIAEEFNLVYEPRQSYFVPHLNLKLVAPADFLQRVAKNVLHYKIDGYKFYIKKNGVEVEYSPEEYLL